MNLSFNVPFNCSLAGPDVDDVLHATPGALQRWTFPDASPENPAPPHQLPVHVNNLEALRRLCRQISESSGGRLEASVSTTEPKVVSPLQLRPHGLVTTVCLSGDAELVRKTRARILNEMPISLVSRALGEGRWSHANWVLAERHRRRRYAFDHGRRHAGGPHLGP